MKPEVFFKRIPCSLLAFCFSIVILLVIFVPVMAQPPTAGKPIVIEEGQEPLADRLNRKITLDVREMNIIDVIKFLSIKGDFNMVTSGAIQGRVTIYLKSVSIKDALDIVLIANNLGYYLENEIVHVMPGAEYEAMFGKKFNDKMEVFITNLTYAKPSYVLSALENIKSTLGRIIIDEDTGSVVMVDTPETLREMKKAIDDMEKPSEVLVYPLQYAKADSVSEKLRARLDAHAVGSLTTDERSNQIIIRAFPERQKEIEQMIRSLDVPTKEVLVEAKILQITLKPQYDIGIDWDLNFKDVQDEELQKLSFKNLYMNESGLSTSDNIGTLFGKIGILDSTSSNTTNAFSAALRSLKQVSDTKILSNPKILVTNNEEAKIHIGDTVPYIISTTSGTGDNAITSEDVRFVDVGLKINVTPTINDDGYVTMKLKPEISTVISKITSKGGGIPQVNKTEVQTTIMVKDGSTIILGGLKKNNNVHTKKGFPFLMDVPFIEKLFSRTADVIEKTEIVIFITPHIITGGENTLWVEGTVKAFKPLEEKRESEKLSTSLRLKE